MKKSDAEIIKALELCTGDHDEISCPECPYKNDEDCYLNSIKDALDLINRLKAENKREQTHNSNLKDALLHQKSYTAKLEKELAIAKEENERLINTPPKDPMDFCGVVCNYAEELISRAKSEAYKEFAEKLKRKAKKPYGNFYEPTVFVEDIDNLLKEMG